MLTPSLSIREDWSMLFWCLKAEMHVPEVSERFGLLLEEYLETVTSYVLGRSELVAFFQRCVVPAVPEVATWA